MPSARIPHGPGPAPATRRPEPAAPRPAPSPQPAHPASLLRRAALDARLLTPGGVLHLQRTVGNRAVGTLLRAAAPRVGLIQRALPSREEFGGGLQAVEAQRNDLEAIGTLLDTYNEIRADEDADFQRRLRALSRLDRAIHEWFGRFKAKKLEEVPNALALKGLLARTRAEHEEVVAQVARNPGLLPVDTTGLSGEEQEKVRTVWTALLQGNGNLRILEKEAGFTKRMHAALARLLEGQTGRDLLADISRGGDDASKRITLSSNFAAELAGTSAVEKAESEAIPLSSLPKEGGKDPGLVGSSADDGVQGLPEYAGTGQDFSPAAFHDFLVASKDDEKVKWGGEAYKRGARSGSYVRMAAEEGYLLGQDDNQILAPEWVTLGHELGHAQRILHGASLHGAELAQMGVADEADQRLWNNPEEYVNINAVENRIRAEHGLSTRKYHAADPKTLKFERNRVAFAQRHALLQQARTPLQRVLFNFHPVEETLRDYHSVKPDFADDEVVEKIRGELNQVEGDTAREDVLWNHLRDAVGREARFRGTMLGSLRVLLPHVTAERAAALPAVLLGYLATARSAAELLRASRQAGNWRVVHAVMAAGHHVPIFQAGLTTEEFEQQVDPNWEIDVEVEFTRADPQAPWWRRYQQVVYVRKNFGKKKQD